MHSLTNQRQRQSVKDQQNESEKIKKIATKKQFICTYQQPCQKGKQDFEALRKGKSCPKPLDFSPYYVPRESHSQAHLD